MDAEPFIQEAFEKLFDWVLAGSFFAAQAFVATGGLNSAVLPFFGG
jgi:hypothetical protein